MSLKKCLCSAALLFLFSVVVAQPVDEDNGSKVYLKVYGGYGLLNPASTRLLAMTWMPPYVYATSKKGLGSGLRFGGGVGVIASDFLNIGIDVDYLNGDKMSVVTQSTDVSSTPNNYAYTLNTYSYTSLSVTPHLIFKAISKPDYLVYTKIGLLLNLPMTVVNYKEDSSTAIGTNDFARNRYSGTYKFGLTPGLNVALGGQFRLTDKLRAFGEIFAHFIALSPTNYDEVGEQVAYGVADQHTATHITYIKDGLPKTSYDATTNTNVTQMPLETNKFTMNTIGINIGLTYRF